MTKQIASAELQAPPLCTTNTTQLTPAQTAHARALHTTTTRAPHTPHALQTHYKPVQVARHASLCGAGCPSRFPRTPLNPARWRPPLAAARAGAAGGNQ